MKNQIAAAASIIDQIGQGRPPGRAGTDGSAYVEIQPPGAPSMPAQIADLAQRVGVLLSEAGIPPMRCLPADTMIRCGAESDRMHTYDEVCARGIIEQMRGRIAAIPQVPGQVAAVRTKYAGGYYLRVEVALCGRR